MAEVESTEDFVGTDVDVNGLWLCGNSYLPALAEPLVAAAEHVAAAADHDSGVSEQIYVSWSNVRGAFQSALYQSVENLYATGDALVIVAHAYDQTDANAGEELDGIVDEAKEKNIEIIDKHDRKLPPKPKETFIEGPPEGSTPDGQPPQAPPL